MWFIRNMYALLAWIYMYMFKARRQQFLINPIFWFHNPTMFHALTILVESTPLDMILIYISSF